MELLEAFCVCGHVAWHAKRGGSSKLGTICGGSKCHGKSNQKGPFLLVPGNVYLSFSS